MRWASIFAGTSRLCQNFGNGLHARVRLSPIVAYGQGAVLPGNKVRDVRLGGNAKECWSPPPPCCQRTEGGEDAVHTGIAALALVQGPLACRIVDERDPRLTEAVSQGDNGQYLGD